MKKIKKHLFPGIILSLIILIITSFLSIISLHNLESQKIRINKDSNQHLSLTIKDNIGDYIIGNISINAGTNKYSNLKIFSYDNFNIEKQTMKFDVLEIQSIDLSKYYNSFDKKYILNDIKIFLPNKNYIFPFGKQKGVINVSLDDESVGYLNINNLSKLKISKINSNIYNGKIVKEISINIEGVLIEFYLPFPFILIYCLFFSFLIGILFVVHKKISATKKATIESIAFITGLAIGLPGIFEAMKMGKVSVYSSFNILSYIIYLWILIIIFQSILIKNKK